MWPRPLWAHTNTRGSIFLIRAPRDGVYSLGKRFKAATRKERPCFAAECGLDRLGTQGPWNEKHGPVLLQNVAPTPLGTHEHSRVHFSILSFRTPKQGVPKGKKQPHEKKGGGLEIGTWPKLKCTFYEQNLVSQNQPQFSRFPEGKQGLEQPHEKNGPVLLQNVASTTVGTHGPRMV